MEKNAFKNRGTLEKEAEKINYRSQHIKIPSSSGQKMVAEFYIHPSTGKFGRVEIVPENQEFDKGPNLFESLEYIDMSIPRMMSKYDKKGYNMFLKSIKSLFFPNARVTKKRAEEFFSNPFNFYETT